MVVFIAVQTLCSIVFFEAIALQVAEKRRFDRNFVLPNDEALAFAHGLVGLVPGMLFDLRCSQSLVRVRFQNLVDKVHALG